MRRIVEHDLPAAIREDRDASMSAQSRRLRNGLISLAIFFALVIAMLLAVPGLRSAGEKITDANVAWVAAGLGFELLSCAGYVVLFELVFKMERRFSRRLALSELGVNSVVSVSGIGGIALGAWVLRTKGVSVERIARRSVLLFVLTSAVNVGAVALIGIPMWLGLLPGSQDALLTLLPAALAIATIVATLVVAALAGQLATRGRLSDGRMHVALVAISDGVRGALRLISRRERRVLGAVGYWLFDTLVLYVCLLAYGPTPTFWAVAMAYLVGLMANSIPIPAGLVAVEGGLIGMLVLFHVRPVSAVVAAVVTYRAICLWLPALIGSVAFFSLRREIGEPVSASPEAAAGG
ncbi:MAG TPA: flippase-like domain-containing protein [Solirubrobacteraceae bacterium]|nr:flippase-like domain-containing protein [Solirubrobacteraceae bacterium]